MFLANLGTPADFTARATFAKSFFETGGIEAIDSEGFADPAALAARLQGLGRRDGLHLFLATRSMPQQRPRRRKALHGAGARHIYLAGRPGDQEAALRAAGISEFCLRRR